MPLVIVLILMALLAGRPREGWRQSFAEDRRRRHDQYLTPSHN